MQESTLKKKEYQSVFLEVIIEKINQKIYLIFNWLKLNIFDISICKKKYDGFFNNVFYPVFLRNSKTIYSKVL